MSESPRSAKIRTVALILLGIGAVAFARYGPVEPDELRALAGRLAEVPGMPVILILTQVLMYALALPGSLVLWVAAPVYPALVASGIILAGGVMGAAVAYHIGAVLGEPTRKKYEHRAAFKVMATHGGFFTQTALRLVPGFPHSLINYSAGILRLHRGKFLLATLLGLSVKWPLYVLAVQGLVDMGDPDAAIGWQTLAPLVALAVLLAGGGWLARRFTPEKE